MNVVEYIQRDWTANPMHPTHKTDNEVKITELRRRIKRAKTSRKKQQLRDAIRELQK